MNDEETITQIAEIIQSSLTVNGQLAIPFYKQFWCNMSDSPENAACYLAVLLCKLVGITSGEDKYTPLPDLVTKIVSDNYNISASEVQKLAPDVDPPLIALKQSILLTLYYIGIHVRFAIVHPSMNHAFAKWIEFNAIQRWINTKSPFVDEVISILTASVNNEESITQLVDNATTVEVPMDLLQDLGDARHLSRALLSSWLVRGSSFSVPKLIDAALKVIKTPNLPETRVLVLMHMLKRLISHTPYISHSTVRAALSQLKNYYSWPRPYGDVAREVMELLTSESKNPGHLLRSIILQEFPTVVKENPKVKISRPAAHGRVIHILVDTQHTDGSIMHDLLKCSPADDPTPAQLQIDLLGNILYRVLGIEADVLGVEHCPPDLVSDLLVEAIDVMDQAAALPEKDARAYRLQHITAIRDKIIDSVEFASYGYPPRHPSPPPFHMSLVQLKCSNPRPKRSEDLTDAQLHIPHRKNCVQALSQIFASYQHQNRTQNQPNGSPTSNPRLSTRGTITPTPPNFSVPLSNPTSPSAKRKSVNLRQGSTNNPSLPPLPRLVRIVVVGSDSALHNVVTGYVTLRREQPSLFTGLDIRFFIIPIACAPPLTITSTLPSPLRTSPTTNHFTSFIAKNDPWYYRHIWVGTYALTSILPAGATSLSISQLQELSAKIASLTATPGSPGSASFRQRAKSSSRSTLAAAEVDRLASSGSLVESLKAVQKQKLAANNFVSPNKPAEVADAPAASGDSTRKKSAGEESKEQKPSTTTLSESTDSTEKPLPNPYITTNANGNTVSTTTSTIITDDNEIIFAIASTEYLTLRRSTSLSLEGVTKSASVDSPRVGTPVADIVNGLEKSVRSGSWTTDSADGIRRKNSGASLSPNRSRSNSGNNDLSGSNGIVVGQSRSRRGSSNPPAPSTPDVSSPSKLSNSHATVDTWRHSTITRTDDYKPNGAPSPRPSRPSSPPLSSSSPTPAAHKAIFRRSNSMGNESDELKQAHRISKSLHHSHSVASFDLPSSSSSEPLPSTPRIDDTPSTGLTSPSPARMLRHELDAYVRDATQQLNVVIFQAECWTIVDNETLFFTVPFLIRAELGITAFARLFAETNDLPSSFSFQDISSHKLFKYNPVPLTMKCTPVNLMGVARTIQMIDPKPYVSITLSNLGPQDKAQQNNSNPTRPWLELSYTEFDPKKKRKEESHTHYVIVVDFETEGKKLVDLLLDGEYYGGVYRVRISTCTGPAINPQSRPSLPTYASSPSLLSSTPPTPISTSTSSSFTSPSTSVEEEPIVFPVMTYLPLNLP